MLCGASPHIPRRVFSLSVTFAGPKVHRDLGLTCLAIKLAGVQIHYILSLYQTLN